MAGAIAELAHKALVADFRAIDPRAARIILVEAGPRILATFPESLSRKAQKGLHKLGVEVRTHEAGEGIDEDGVGVGGRRWEGRMARRVGGEEGGNGKEVEEGRPDPRNGKEVEKGRPDPHNGKEVEKGRPDPRDGKEVEKGRPDPHKGGHYMFDRRTEREKPF